MPWLGDAFIKRNSSPWKRMPDMPDRDALLEIKANRYLFSRPSRVQHKDFLKRDSGCTLPLLMTPFHNPNTGSRMWRTQYHAAQLPLLLCIAYSITASYGGTLLTGWRARGWRANAYGDGGIRVNDCGLAFIGIYNIYKLTWVKDGTQTNLLNTNTLQIVSLSSTPCSGRAARATSGR